MRKTIVPVQEATPLQKVAGKTLYARLAEVLRGELQGLQRGAAVAGDRQLGERFSVSQPVVRAALALLVAEGRVHRTRGRGTFVGPAPTPGGAVVAKVAVVSPLADYFPHVNAFPGIARMLSARGVDLTYHEARVDAPIGPAGEVVSYRDAHADAQISMADEILPDLLARNRGVIWISPFSVEVPQAPAVLSKMSERVVFLNSHFMDEGVTGVMPDHFAGAFNMCRHLFESGRDRLAYLGGPKGFLFAEIRLDAYHKAVAWAGKNPCPAHVREYLDARRPQQEEAYACVRRMLALRQRPDAIFGVTDIIAIEAMQAIRDAGLRCPEDVAVGGFDDRASAARQRPPLTTVRDPYYEMGREAARQLLEQLDGTRKPGGCTLMPCPLVIRESCGAGLRTAQA